MYTLYVHIFPNKKKYVGVTREKPEKRFGFMGNGYRTKKMRQAIDEFGWNNIEHKIIKTDLSYEDAIKFEKLYIKKYNTCDHRYGYNQKKGGGFSKESKSYIHKNTPNRQKWYDKLKNVPLSDSHKKSVSDGHLRRLNRFICQYKDDKLIKKWASATEIKKDLGYDKTHIGRCCKYNSNQNQKKSAYGFVWVYEKKESNI